MSQDCIKAPDQDTKPGSPIPGKIQEVLQQFQARLSEKDVQITELQKKIETLEVGGKVTKSLSFRSTTKNQRETNTRPPSGKPTNNTTSGTNGVKKHVRSNTNNSNDKSASSTTNTSKSVPTSPSKKPAIPPKPIQTRPSSRQAVSNTDQNINGNSKVTKATVTRTASVDRGRINRKVQEKIPPRKLRNDINGSSLPKSNYTKMNISSAAGDRMMNLKLTCQANKLTRSADSLSTHSVDSQASSAADFVSVSSGASPSPTQSIDCNPLSSDDVIPYSDLALRLKRLTEEHDKLQAEHARLRLQLGSSMEASDGGTLSGESKMITSSGLWSSKGASEIDSDNSLIEGVESGGDCAREFCKEEVLRLRDELMNLQKLNNEMNKRLEERFSRIQDLLDEKENLTKILTEKGLEIVTTVEKLNILQKDYDIKTSKLVHIEEEHQRLKSKLELVDSKNREMWKELNEKTQSLKELEKESSEMKDFMQAERLTLSEALSDCESQLEKSSSRVAHLQAQLEVKSQSLQALQSTIETQKLQLTEYKTEVDVLKSASRDLLLKQGAELSCSSVALSQVVQNLESIVLNLTAQVDGQEKVSSAVLPECDQQVSPCENNGDEKTSSLVNVVLKAVDHLETPNKEKSSLIDEKRQEVEVSNDFGIGIGMRRDDSAVSINSILSEGGDCPLLVGDLNQIITPGKVGCLLDQVKDVEGLLMQLAKLIKVTGNNHQIELKKMIEKNIEMKSEMELKLNKAEFKVNELELREKQMKSEMQIMQNQLNSAQTSLELSQRQYRELNNDYEKLIKERVEVTDLQQQIIDLKTAQSIMEAEKKEYDNQIAEYSKRIDDLALRNNGVSESIAELVNEKYSLKKEISKLRVHLCEKDEEINNLRIRYTKHAGILQNNCKYADSELKQLEEILDYVVKTLKNIPEIVQNCDSLKTMLIRLAPDTST